MLDASTDAIFWETLDGRILDCNDAACQMFGYTRQEFLQLTVVDLVPPDVAATLPDVIAREQNTGGVLIKSANKRKDGQVFPVEVSTKVVMIEDEPRVVAYVRDISQQERTSQALTHHTQELMALFETSLEINAQHDVSKLLRAIVERATRLVGAPMGGLYLMRPDNETLELVVSYNLPRDYTGVILRLGEGLSGQVAESGRTTTVENYSDWGGQAEIYRGNPFRRVLGVPLKIEERVIGVINITDTQRTGQYSEQEIQLVSQFANQAAIAIQNARLYEAAQSELVERKRAEKVQAALYRISEAAQTAGDLGELYGLIHAIIGGLMPANNFYIALYDDVTDLLSFPYFADEFDVATPPQKPGRGLTEYVLRNGQPLLATPDVYRRLLVDGQVEMIGTDSIDWLGVPLKTASKTIGIMAVQTYDPQLRYSQADQDILIFVSAQVAMAIERKRAEAALRESAKRYRLLFENAPLGILLVNSQGVIIEANPTALHFLGSTSVDAAKAINVLAFPAMVEAGFSANVQRCLQTGQSQVAECFYTGRWGEAIYLHYHIAPVLDVDGTPGLVQVIAEDITERKLAEQALRENEERYRSLYLSAQRQAQELELLHQVRTAIGHEVDLAAIFRTAVESIGQMFGYTQVSLYMIEGERPLSSNGEQSEDSSPPASILVCQHQTGYDRIIRHIPISQGVSGRVARTGQPVLIEDVRSDADFLGAIDNVVSEVCVPLLNKEQVVGVLNVESVQGVKLTEADLRLVVAVGEYVSMAIGRTRLYEAARQSEARMYSVLQTVPEMIYSIDPSYKIQYANQTLPGLTLEQTVGANVISLVAPEYRAQVKAEIDQVFQSGKRGSYTVVIQSLPSQPRWYETNIGPVFADDGKVVAATLATRDITERREAEAQIKKLNRTLQLLYDAGLTLNRMLDPREQLEMLCNIAMQTIHADHSGFFGYDAANDEVFYEFGIGRGADLAILQTLRVRVGEQRGLIGLVAQTRTPLYLSDVTADPRWVVTDPQLRSALWVPVEYEHHLLGLISMTSTRLDAFTPDDQQLLALLANQVAVSQENAHLYAASVDAAERRTALHWLSQEIISTQLEPERIYRAIHQAALQLMPAEAFVISVLDETCDEIELAYCVDRGRRYPLQRIARQRGVSGSVIASGKVLLINDLERDGSEINLVPFGDPPQVRSVLAAPMRLGNRIFGMLSAQCLRPHAYTLDDAHLLEILASYAAIALENARLFSQMQTANIDLSKAYEATIEGWSRALEMRDKETRGHSERVSRFSLRLAREMGMGEDEIVHFRRGVLLHDIGKMAIPDNILLKPGSLTEDEWVIMRQHPVYAYQMLAGVPFTSQALDVPYCHHERWDGSGYPRGLREDNIPLGARIFAVIDVWDALSNDRPYRPAWLSGAVRSYIAAQAGRHFDPRVVDAFLKLLDTGEFA